MLRAIALALRVGLAFAPLIRLLAAPFLDAARYRACASRRACIRSAHVCFDANTSMISIGFMRNVNREKPFRLGSHGK
jgi:hypothetical protein